MLYNSITPPSGGFPPKASAQIADIEMIIHLTVKLARAFILKITALFSQQCYATANLKLTHIALA